jgi:hypothetical protein
MPQDTNFISSQAASANAHEPDKARRRETVILVHGTFAAPKQEGEAQWYEPGSDFVRMLDEELASRGSTAKCWAIAGNVSLCHAAYYTNRPYIAAIDANARVAKE